MIKYSIVIPTRDRFAYLNSAIESCLAFNRSDFEVIVSINTAKTWPQILEEYEPVDDVRVRYIITGALLSMNQNFNFGLLQARGDYIATLGDDDAFLPAALDFADQFFAQQPELPLCWFRRPYFWPDYEQLPFSNLVPNTLHCWTAINLQIVESRPLLEKICNQYVPYHSLPSIYNSFYPRQLVQRFRDAQLELEGESTPRSIFLKQVLSVDVFTAYAALVFTSKFGLISIPLSISGISSRSNGMSGLRKIQGEESVKFYQEMPSSLRSSIASGPFAGYQNMHVQICNDGCKALEEYRKCSTWNVPLIQPTSIASSLIDSFCDSEFINQPWTTPEIIRLSVDFGQTSKLDRLAEILTWYVKNYEDQLCLWEKEQQEPPKVATSSESYCIINCKYFNVSTAYEAVRLYQEILANPSTLSGSSQ